MTTLTHIADLAARAPRAALIDALGMGALMLLILSGFVLS